MSDIKNAKVKIENISYLFLCRIHRRVGYSQTSAGGAAFRSLPTVGRRTPERELYKNDVRPPNFAAFFSLLSSVAHR